MRIDYISYALSTKEDKNIIAPSHHAIFNIEQQDLIELIKMSPIRLDKKYAGCEKILL